MAMSAGVVDSAAALAVGVDVGATTVKAAAVSAGGAVALTVERPTPGSTAEIDQCILDLVRYISETQGPPLGLGIGTPGWTSADRRHVVYSPNLPWRDYPIADRLEQALQLPVVLENDANAAAWGEYRFGAGRGSTSMVLVTLGSGVGGAIVIGETLIRGHHGCAGELGHALRETNGRPCECGRRGCLENYVSGRALVRRAAEILGPDVNLHRAALDGDPRAIAVYTEFGEHLGRGLADDVMLLDPQFVVIGGGVATSFEHFAPATRQALDDELGPNWRGIAPDVVVAELGPDAGRTGVADLARQNANNRSGMAR
jgi:glucokinase